jgi:hypothetical protein
MGYDDELAELLSKSTETEPFLFDALHRAIRTIPYLKLLAILETAGYEITKKPVQRSDKRKRPDAVIAPGQVLGGCSRLPANGGVRGPERPVYLPLPQQPRQSFWS